MVPGMDVYGMYYSINMYDSFNPIAIVAFLLPWYAARYQVPYTAVQLLVQAVQQYLVHGINMIRVPGTAA